MSFNFSELQQKADRVLHNADEFVRRYVQFALAPAQDVSVQYYDQNGNLQTATFPNRQKLVNQFFNDVNSAMVRTYYVDQVNGSDNNDGTQQRPFKTLQKAVNSVPTGGYGAVILLRDYTLDNHVFINRKHIKINLNGKTLATVYYGLQDNRHLKWHIYLTSASLEFEGFGKLFVPNIPDNRPLSPDAHGFITMNGFGFNAVMFIPWTMTPHVWAEILSGSLVSYNSWDNAIPSHAFVGFHPHYRGILRLGADSYFINTVGRPFTIGVYIENNDWTGYIERYNPSTGQYQQIPVSQAIAGIVRDSNGVPRNIISNLVL